MAGFVTQKRIHTIMCSWNWHNRMSFLTIAYDTMWFRLGFFAIGKRKGVLFIGTQSRDTLPNITSTVANLSCMVYMLDVKYLKLLALLHMCSLTYTECCNKHE